MIIIIYHNANRLITYIYIYIQLFENKTQYEFVQYIYHEHENCRSYVHPLRSPTFRQHFARSFTFSAM